MTTILDLSVHVEDIFANLKNQGGISHVNGHVQLNAKYISSRESAERASLYFFDYLHDRLIHLNYSFITYNTKIFTFEVSSP